MCQGVLGTMSGFGHFDRVESRVLYIFNNGPSVYVNRQPVFIGNLFANVANVSIIPA